jgi:hypothetical protein
MLTVAGGMHTVLCTEVHHELNGRIVNSSVTDKCTTNPPVCMCIYEVKTRHVSNYYVQLRYMYNVCILSAEADVQQYTVRKLNFHETFIETLYI